MKLIIVESPTKAKTISGFLGKDFKVLSSYGHVRDLPKSKLGIDVKNNFLPTYVIPTKAKENVETLKKEASKAQEVILASDEDREGEAIAWHIAQILSESKDKKKKNNNFERIVFHEITEDAIKNALKNPRNIDQNLVDAQQARRVLDRLVGYKLSPFLWHKIRYGLSAGRVQSVALRLIVEREREIQNFNKEEYWTIEGNFLKAGDKKIFSAKLYSIDGKKMDKMEISDKNETEKITANLNGLKYSVASINKKEVYRNPYPPFTTSTLQQEASRRFGFSAKQTMVIAQKLYENGLITYMRTDSLNLSFSALSQAQQIIGKAFGKNYQLDSPRYFTNKSKGAQEAHEAIRPTNLAKSPEMANLKDRSQSRLYTLIWKRTIACQMQSAKVQQTSVDIKDEDNRYVFRATGQTIIFDGFLKVYSSGESDTQEDKENNLPSLKENDKIISKEILPIQHFTEPPARYTDAALIKALEYFGVGRPSTYAPTLSTIQERGYVEKTEKKYHPTEIGFMVNDMLVEHFPEIIDVNFTAHIEEELDEIAQGQIPWVNVCQEFYIPFEKHLDEKESEVQKNIQISDTLCPHCGKPMLIKFGRMGKFLACPQEGSKITLPMPEEAAKIKELEEKTRGEKCPLCGKPMKVKRGRFGYFLGCVDYPKCKGISRIWNKTGFVCPLCLDTPERKNNPGDIVEKKGRGRGKPFYACTRWPDCNFIINKKPETEKELTELYNQWKEKPKDKTSKKFHKKDRVKT